ncbi:MAG: hypothetical protein A2144_02595 [Chloroflexi bacterium RBG_16_50_9]|nr:MAG: hypothetical protein A2144_02595 [Chloroflexi bacterium RBG_16_50_9]
MWVIAILASLVILVVLALSVPLDLGVSVDMSGRPKFRMRLKWFFGLISGEIGKKEDKTEDEEKGVKGRRKPGKKGPGVRTMLEILRTRGLLRRVRLLLKDIFRLIRIKDLAADLKVGLGDPAGTGVLFAIMGPLHFFLSSSLSDRVKVQFVADEAVLEGSLHGSLRLQPILLIPPMLRFIISRPVLRAAKILVTKNR